MKKNLLNDLYICDLYQVDKEIGYLSKSDLNPETCLFDDTLKKINVNKVGTVIVKKSNLCKYRLKEIITGLPIDTIHLVHNKNLKLKIDANKKEYDTIIIVPLFVKGITLDEFNNYCDEHPDAKEYRNQLIELLNQGKVNHDKMKHENYLKKQEIDRAEIERINSINSHVKEKSYKRVKNINNNY